MMANMTRRRTHFSMLIPRTMLRSHLNGSNISASSLRLTKATWLLSMDCKVAMKARGRGREKREGYVGGEWRKESKKEGNEKDDRVE